jgi:error-prone DNA polymerase
VVRGLRDEVLPLFAAADAACTPQPEFLEPSVPVVPISASGNVVDDYESVGLTLRQHPVAFLRSELRPRGISPCSALSSARDGQPIIVAGLVLVRQRPGSGNAIFITIEDEGGIANLVVWLRVYEQYRRVILGASMLGCRGRVQREGDVIHVVAEEFRDFSGLLRSVGSREEPLAGCEGVAEPGAAGQRSIRVPSRDFR